MGVFLTWLSILLFIGLILGLFKPRFLRFLVPIKKKLTRKHNLAIFSTSLLVCLVSMFFVLRTSATSKEKEEGENNKEEKEKIKKQAETLVDLEETASMNPDPDSQDGFTVPKVRVTSEQKQTAEKEISTKKDTEDKEDTKIYGCTDPTASNYNPNATTNDGSCINTSSD